ncbi:hypothetical protein V8J88_23180 [Massilia sp. W12]|uniref:Tse2 family ADP-ribosyltransferase toxin n=1 Tax=Massilia sp. W12 TaxID=3126507 RepID=UPI0030CC4A0E
MTDELKKVYESHKLLHRYFDKEVPKDLFRGQQPKEAKLGLPIIYPNPGFKKADGSIRPPDVLIEERDGIKFVAGCRTIRGKYRGISVFDKANPALRSFKWYKLPAGVKIPEALAITQEDDYSDQPNHFTIAPKDDMPLELFESWLKILCDQLIPL